MHKNKVAVTVRCKHIQKKKKSHLYLYLDKQASLYKHSSRLKGSLSYTQRINCYWVQLLISLTITAEFQMPIKRLKLQPMTYYLPLNATDNVSAVSVQPAGHPGILGRFLRKERSWRNTAVVTGEKSLIKISVLFCFSCTSEWKSHAFKADQSIQSQTTITAISKNHVSWEIQSAKK